MPTTWDSVFNPGYPLSVLAILAALSWVAGRLSPFYRRELATEGGSRLAPLDGLRGVLCFAVMFYHAMVTFEYVDSQTWAAPPSALYSALGQTSVALFFCVTGFLFWRGVEGRGGDLPPWPFLRARIYRIVPLYVLSCVLAVTAVAPRLTGFSRSTVRGWVCLGLMGVRPWESIGSVEVWRVNAGVTWSLQYEWGFYFLLPALATVVRGGGSSRLWFLALGAVAMLDRGSPVLFFLPGVLAAYVVQRPGAVRRLRSPCASLGVVALTLAFPSLTSGGFGYVPLVLTTLIFLPIAVGNSVFGVLNLRGLRLMGLTSYSVYLLHGICLYVAQPWLARAKHGDGGGVRLYWCYVAGCAVVTLAVSALTYRWVEWPFIQLERRTRRLMREGLPARSVGEESGPGPFLRRYLPFSVSATVPEP